MERDINTKELKEATKRVMEIARVCLPQGEDRGLQVIGDSCDYGAGDEQSVRCHARAKGATYEATAFAASPPDSSSRIIPNPPTTLSQAAVPDIRRQVVLQRPIMHHRQRESVVSIHQPYDPNLYGGVYIFHSGWWTGLV